MVKKQQILVIGNNDNGCTPEVEKIAYEVGSEHQRCQNYQ